ncbi:MAG: hypothetical protein V1758_04030, partial [Pseudomonadota bacterium]
AVMTCTMRGGIMEGEDGLFDPTGMLSGADALLIIRKLKRELNIFSGIMSIENYLETPETITARAF